MAKTAAQGSPTYTQPPQFLGKTGKHRLRESLRAQTLVSRDANLAKTLVSSGTVAQFQKDDVLIQQGEPDNDILFLVHGEVSILVNERQVATRSAGTHVGELSLVDPVAVRSATVKAVEPTVVLRVPEHKFSRIANKHPDLWRRIAVEVAKRLKERNRVLRVPHSEPVLFIGSSTEGLDVADAVHANTIRRKVIPRTWSDGVFEASTTSIESLVALTHEADFAALVFTADDTVVSRGKKKASPRDNVIFELGLLMGALGRERVFILKPAKVDIRIPSDLLGVTWLEYRKGGPGSMTSKLKPACERILKRIKALGSR